MVILERAVKVRWPFYARKDACTTGLRMLNQTGSAFFSVSPGCSNAERHAGCVVADAPKGWMEGWTSIGRRKRGEKGLFCGRLHTQAGGRSPQQLRLWRVKGREVRVHAAHCCQCKTGHRDWNQSIHPSIHPSIHASILPRTPNGGAQKTSLWCKSTLRKALMCFYNNAQLHHHHQQKK